MLWLVLSFIAAIFSSLIAIFAKIGVKNVNSDFATFYRTGVVIVFSALMCFVAGGFSSFFGFTPENYIFLCLSGAATGGSRLCEYAALADASANPVVVGRWESFRFCLLWRFVWSF